MGQKKLIRFEAIKGYENVFEYPLNAKGTWKDFFKNNNPITLELACGKGEYAVGLGKMHPNRNFIGIDIKGNRIWRGATNALELGLTNVAFIRSLIDKVPDYFNPTEIDEIWITFPDPFPRDGDEKRRLTSPKFLDMYKPMIKKGGLVHFKTDNTGLFDYTLELVQSRDDIEVLAFTHDFYQSEMRDDHHGIKTRYEKIFSDKGEKIKYLKFRFK